MRNKITPGIILLFISIGLNIFQNHAFSQDRYLMVLDIQDFAHKSLQQSRLAEEMIRNVNTLTGHFNPGQVIYIKAQGRVLTISLRGISVDTLPVRAFDSTLLVVSRNIFTKTEADAFTSSDLNSFLETRKAKEIVLTGLMAEKCLYHTAIGGKGKGYEMTIVPECILGTTTRKKEKAIKKMRKKGIRSVSMQEIMDAP